MNRYILTAAALLLAGLACNFGTQEAQPQAGGTPVPAQPLPSTTVALPLPPQATTTPPPTPTEAPSPFQPAAFLVMDAENSLSLYDFQGQNLARLQAPGLENVPSGGVHVAGRWSQGEFNLPLIYLAYGDTVNVRQSLNGQVSNLVADIDLTYLHGAMGQAPYVYVLTTGGAQALVSRVYLGGNPNPLMERVDPEYFAVFPLALPASQGNVSGVWYSLTPYGIGGDIVFPPHKGLFYLDLANPGAENRYLDDGFSPLGLSPDLTWLAYMPAEGGFVAGSPARLTLYNLYTAARVEVALNPESDRGAGHAVFAPDNRRVAWMEGAGWLMDEPPSFRSRLVIADIGGNILASLDAAALGNAVGIANAVWVEPVGWLDGENLLVEVRDANWENNGLARLRYDGGQITLLARGMFAGFVYP